MDERGVIYVASGQLRYGCEAIASARSAAEKMPGIPVSLFTDLPELLGRVIEPFECILPIPEPAAAEAERHHPKLGKIRSIASSPYRKTLFLDSDTRVLARDVARLFDLLDECDFAAVPCTPRTSRSCALYGPMFNTGVVAYRRSARTAALFRAWEQAMLYHLGLVGRTVGAIPYLSRLSAEEVTFLLTKDQLSLAQTLSPQRNDLDLRACLLDDSWNARNLPRSALQHVRIDHANRHKVRADDVDGALAALRLEWLAR